MSKIEDLSSITLRSQAQSSKTTICPAANISYLGDCPNTGCPANLTLLSQGGKTGCFYNYGRPELDTIAQVLNLPLKEVKARYASGLRNLELMIVFVNTVKQTRQRDYEDNTKKFCQACGIGKPTPGNCINTIRCQQRSNFTQRHLRKYPLNIPEVNLTIFDIWHLVKCQADDPEFPNLFSSAAMAQAELLTKRLS